MLLALIAQGPLRAGWLAGLGTFRSSRQHGFAPFCAAHQDNAIGPPSFCLVGAAATTRHAGALATPH